MTVYTAMICEHGIVVAGTLELDEQIARMWLEPRDADRLEVRSDVTIQHCKLCVA